VPALSATAAPPPALAPRAPSDRIAAWWPLAAVLALGAVLRLATLDLQSFWYDEAFTPVHVLHTGLGATLRAVVHTENSPPLWYLIAWADVRLFGDGEVALRLPSALAGVATIAVAWGIGAELAGRRCALFAAALTAVGPLFVWFSQEARVYALFTLTGGLALLCFLRARREPTPVRMAAFALAGALALVTHYFAVFLLAPMVLLLLRERALRRSAAPACVAVALVGAALLPLAIAQGGHGTQWIGRWALSSRLAAIPQYYLTGYSGAPLGHGVELLVALPLLAALGLWVWRVAGAARGREEGAPGAATAVLVIAVTAVLAPVLLAIAGADYLAPRNLVAAMIPLTALLAFVLASAQLGRAGVWLAAFAAAGFLAISIDVSLSPRLQRGNWRALARVLRSGPPAQAIGTVQLGAAPLQYYLPGLHRLAPGADATVAELAETGFAPLRPSAGRPPAPGFYLRERRDIDGLIVYRFASAAPRPLSGAVLARHVITRARSDVLVARGVHVTSAGARG
jgi:mannosyltransferase